MVILNGVKTNISELKLIILEHKEQLRRMKILDIDNYPIIVNIKNDTGIEDDWEFDID
jgi:hypothetical protein